MFIKILRKSINISIHLLLLCELVISLLAMVYNIPLTGDFLETELLSCLLFGCWHYFNRVLDEFIGV